MFKKLWGQIVAFVTGRGCCYCGGPDEDVLTGPHPNAPNGEHYCWSCRDANPAIAAGVVKVLRERS